MNYLELTLPTPEENLALDEALLDFAEEEYNREILRVWEPLHPFAVLGYGNRAHQELHLARCQAENIPVLRRCSGGGTVLQGPGCLNYTLILNIRQNPRLESIAHTNRCIMQKHQAAIQHLIPSGIIEIQGHTDLALDRKKFSGNAQRRKRAFLLFHGSFLLSFDLPMIERFLQFPPKPPLYRAGRSHLEFVTNLPLPAAMLSSALKRCWSAAEILTEVPVHRVQRRIKEKYGQQNWNFKF
jgi:lipoate---protein ligase